MIKFFRKIRYNLMSENKTGKPALPAGRYFKYAVGEIILVVIGILIALQINNWNENRKDIAVGKQYLKGIKDDLQKDLVLADTILKIYTYNISVVSSIDSVFHRKHQHLENTNSSLFVKPQTIIPDTIIIDYLFDRNTSFRSVNGTYKSLIADGKSGLVKNKELFQEIQQIYDGELARLVSTYESIKMIEQKINWAYPFEIQHWDYDALKKAKNEKIFLDIVDFTEEKFYYALNLIRIKKASQKVISLIDKELVND